MNVSEIKTQLRSEIEKRLGAYSQYQDYFDDSKGWKLAVAKKVVKFKSGDIEKGEFVLLREGEPIEYDKLIGEEYHRLSEEAVDLYHLTPEVVYRHSLGILTLRPNAYGCKMNKKDALKAFTILE